MYSELSNLGNLGLSAIGRITDVWRGAKSDSLIDYTQVTRVEPICLIDADCLYLDMLSDVLQSLNSQFAGYYLQAVAVSATVGKIEVRKHLDKLNPHRSPSDSAADTAGYLLAQESYKYALPTPEKFKQISLEAEEGSSAFGFSKDTASTLKDLADLSVGKQFMVEITDGNNRASIPVNIRLLASSMPSKNLVHILSLNNQDRSVKERYHAWKAGRLSFIKDLILCQDIIDAHRKNLMADKDGVYSNLIKRSRDNGISTILSGNPSVATASNLIVMSSETAAQLELDVNGRLEDFKTREKVFKETYVMIMAVIDKQWQRVTFYYRGINHHTQLGVRDLKASNKGGGPDVSEILKAYQVGNSPSL
jgi:hypothetical protein